MMQRQGIVPANRLPDDGDAVNFLVEGHTVWMAGIYRHGYFEAHWGTYGAGRVELWTPLEPDDESQTARAEAI